VVTVADTAPIDGRQAEELLLRRALRQKLFGRVPSYSLDRLARLLVAEVKAQGWAGPVEVSERIAAEGHCCERPGG